MNTSKRPWIQVLFVLPLFFAACTPVAETPTSAISGGIFFDCNKDGKCARDDVEIGLAGMDIRLYHGGCGENLVQTHQTNEKGEFLFSGLEPGEYCVFPDFQMKNCGWSGNLPTTAISRHVTLESGMKADVTWFGFGTLAEDGQP